MSVDLEHLKQWVGRREYRSDRVAPVPVAALSATLDRDDPPPRDGDPLPPLWHWLFFVPLTRRSEVGPDGHAKRGGFLPPVPLPRRMWAGSRFELLRAPRVGEALERVSTVESVDARHGRSGELVFVVVRHEIAAAGAPAIREWHDIVYREMPRAGDAAPAAQPAPGDAEWRREVVPDDVLLFRYSALTFNGHRIHYDRRYATGVEGYPGLVVHGPLLATLLLDLLREHRPGADVAAFAFRALRPVFDVAPFAIGGTPSEGREVRLWVQDGEGHLAMEATATLR